MAARLGKKATLPHLKETKQVDYRNVYTAEGADIVAQWFAKDIEQFGYTFDDPGGISRGDFDASRSTFRAK